MTTTAASTFTHLDNVSKSDFISDKPIYDDIHSTAPGTPLTPITPFEEHHDHVDIGKTNSMPDPEGLAAAVERSTHPRANIPQWAWIVTLVGQYTGALLFGLDTTITATVQASIYKVGSRYIQTLHGCRLTTP